MQRRSSVWYNNKNLVEENKKVVIYGHSVYFYKELKDEMNKKGFSLRSVTKQYLKNKEQYEDNDLNSIRYWQKYSRKISFERN
jgi:wobble nucleotide-excising tRNase